MSELQAESYKKIRLVTRTPEANGALQAIVEMGAANMVIDENSASFIFRGDLNAMLAVLSNLKLQDLTIEEPDLEEVFLHYYR